MKFTSRQRGRLTQISRYAWIEMALNRAPQTLLAEIPELVLARLRTNLEEIEEHIDPLRGTRPDKIWDPIGLAKFIRRVMREIALGYLKNDTFYMVLRDLGMVANIVDPQGVEKGEAA